MARAPEGSAGDDPSNPVAAGSAQVRSTATAGCAPEGEDWGALDAAVRRRPDGLFEARRHPEHATDPDPLAPGEVLRLARAVEPNYRAAMESILAALPPDRRDRYWLVTRESQGTWSLLLETPAGSALYVGNPLCGGAVPLATVGFRVTLIDLDPERLWLAVRMVTHQAPGRVRGVLAGDGPRLPFADHSFDVVVYDDLAPSAALLAELRRLCRRELVVTGDNRLGYKRSAGHTFDFRVPHPLQYARRVLRPPGGERTLLGWRRTLRSKPFERPRALALYPDRRDYAHVVALDAAHPRLFVGPNERRNRVKMGAQAAGLFPLFTPSFAFLTRRRGLAAGPSRLERMLQGLAREIGEPVPRAEHLIGTRGNTCVVMTEVAGRSDGDPEGRWLLHLPLHLGHQPGLEGHFRALGRVQRDFPGVPVPQPLVQRELEGLPVTCERRLPGCSSNHVIDDRAVADRILFEMAGHLAQLVLEPARPLTAQEFERDVATWFERVLRAVGDPNVRASLERRRLDAERLLVGRSLPRMFGHGDVRAKHVLFDERSGITGYVDWGTVMESALPGLDLMHRIVHDRKQVLGQHDGAAWRELLDPQRLLPGERRALDRYASDLGLEPRALHAVAHVYPMYVGAVIDTYSPFVQPGWYRRTFGV